jgi:hypothetical protein
MKFSTAERLFQKDLMNFSEDFAAMCIPKNRPSDLKDG